MSGQFDYKKEWEKTKVQLLKFGKEATVLAKKGEEELVKFSKKSKIQIDSTAAGLKIEKLYYVIGKEYVALKDRAVPSAKLIKFLSDVEALELEQKNLRSKLKTKATAKTKTTDKKTKTKNATKNTK
ncbi:MAG: hypothetical protein ACI9F2_000852 [Lysobacterales bacterium]|jgi:hypothetical protein